MICEAILISYSGFTNWETVIALGSHQSGFFFSVFLSLNHVVCFFFLLFFPAKHIIVGLLIKIACIHPVPCTHSPRTSKENFKILIKHKTKQRTTNKQKLTKEDVTHIHIHNVQITMYIYIYIYIHCDLNIVDVNVCHVLFCKFLFVCCSLFCFVFY